MSQTYEDKRSHYFSGTRTEIEPLLANCAESALEVGCGTGATMSWLRKTGRVKHAIGIELFDSAATQAQPYFEHISVGDAESIILSFADRRFDLILCLDVLEHMVDPWKFLESAEKLLTPQGKLVISVPNIRCARVLWPLLTRGEWTYENDGILDRTHLRFFTRKTAIKLAESRSLKVSGCLGYTRPDTRLAKIDKWSKGYLSDFTSQQFIVSASLA